MAAENSEKDNTIAQFVGAADRLVNLLASPPSESQAAKDAHQKSLDAAYDEYDVARMALTGFDPFAD